MLPPTFTWGNRIAQRAAESDLSGVPEPQPHAQRDVSATKVVGRHTLKAGFYWFSAYKAENLGISGAIPFNGPAQRSTTTRTTRSTPASATPTRRSAFSRTTHSSRSSSKGGYRYKNVEWYLQDNWKREQPADARLRPALHASAAAARLACCRRRTSSPTGGTCANAPAALSFRAVRSTASPCPSASRVAVNPVTGESLGPTARSRSARSCRTPAIRPTASSRRVTESQGELHLAEDRRWRPVLESPTT